MRAARLAGPLVAAGLIATLIAAAPLRAAVPRTASAPRCTTDQLRVSLGGGAGAGMSQLRTGVQLRNVGRHACTLSGYPGVSWLSAANGQQVGPAAQRARFDGSSHVVTLAPHHLASAGLDIVEGDGGLSRSQCHPEHVTGLEIYPPGATTARFIKVQYEDRAGACSVKTPVSLLSVGPVVPGAQPGDGGR